MKGSQEEGKKGRFGDTKNAWAAGEKAERLARSVIGACIDVHRHLGPGLLESAYEECLCHELTIRCIRFDRQRSIAITYRGLALDCGYRADVIVEGAVLVELKAVERLLPIHIAQALTYLKLTGLPIALLVNFHSYALKQGLRRLSNPNLSGVASLRHAEESVRGR